MKLEKRVLLERWMDEYDMPIYELDFDVINEYDGCQIVLFDVDAQAEIFIGDWYHDQIKSKINGFLKCLEYLNIEYSIEEKVAR